MGMRKSGYAIFPPKDAKIARLFCLFWINRYSVYPVNSAIGSGFDGILFRSFRNQNRSQKNTITVNSVYSHSGIGTLRSRTGEDDDGFPEVKLLLGSAMRMSQWLHHPVLPHLRREVECFAVVPERDYLLGFLTLEPPSICSLWSMYYAFDS